MAVGFKRGAAHGASDPTAGPSLKSRDIRSSLYICVFIRKYTVCASSGKRKWGCVKYLVRTVPGLCSACGEVSEEIKGLSILKPNTEERFPLPRGREIPSLFLLLGGIRSNNMIQPKIER